MIFYILMISLIFLTFIGIESSSMILKARFRSRLLSQGLEVLEDQIRTKQGILKEIEHLEQGLCTPEECEQDKAALTAVEEVLRTERGRLTISEAELEALETRLREMEEIERELAASQLETEREIDMLRIQESEINSRKEELTKQIQDTVTKLDESLKELELSAQQEQDISSAKARLVEAEEKVQYYTEQAAVLNERYLELKRAYDALDIEYAQLYEKQNELEAAQQSAE